MVTIMWPCDRNNVWITDDWSEHLARPGYNRAYAGTDLAGPEQPLNPSQYNGKVLQAMWSNVGYGYTTFVEHYDQTGKAVLRIRNAHQKNLAVSTGDIVNPGDLLGTMDSTGNSTGTHTHWEVWLVINGQWQNIDPLDPKFGVTIVGDQSALEPLDGSEPPEVPVFEVPDVTFAKVKNIIRYPINLRSAPFVSAGARILGSVAPGSVWDYCGHKVDVLGNTWFALRSGDKIGWSAAHYNGADWIVPIKEDD